MKRRKKVEQDATASRVAQRLSSLIQVATMAPPAGQALEHEAEASFARFRSLLTEYYPRTFAAAQIDEVGRAGLLLRIAGQTADRPVVLMAHQDVVPVPDDWEAEGWERPPFAGVIADGFVHGRGALDDKGALAVMLEAIEGLLEDGWTPPRDLYVLMGADEEVYGSSAVEATALLAARGVEPYLVLDEGGAVATGAFPTVKRELAVVGVAEKGILTVEISAEGTGGHASTPPKRSAAGLVAAAICELEEHPFPCSVNDVTVELFATVAPHASLAMRGLLRRADSLRPVIARVLPRLGPEMAAMVRTTTAVTMLAASPSHNVLATRASAVLNIRVATGTSTEQAVARLIDVIDDKRIAVSVLERSEPSPVSPGGNDPRWLAIRDAVAASYPDAVTVPYVMLAASDARHVNAIAPAVYRFAPLRMSAQQRAAVHGPNEKVEVESLGRGVVFYRALLTGPLMAGEV
ncbi:M20/M25/M40 family metallo-hydrolase [Demequina sp. TTPB684]|uniref:M20/M25/M40 family metallo-hydrolase n=1 Tax=unclassified Demequina TaxID=2620311 RepID=UPI001CF5967B|nr:MULTISPECIES: M20/M25/M40 family metallo-hydrolase [unclassified Demequina]MCB2412846.1 M20/M25/M40 family metallo-hydrolase [Demequina sp. TTPB684]UPU87523.1 M20/M25/M40 family metallo-hydrolase [Demequina sp. TMPB413]